jgi:hypothetical protein
MSWFESYRAWWAAHRPDLDAWCSLAGIVLITATLVFGFVRAVVDRRNGKGGDA